MVVNVNDGKHLGVIVDAELNSEGNIIYFLVMNKHFFRRFFKNEPEINVKFSQITKIGEDVILVDFFILFLYNMYGDKIE